MLARPANAQEKTTTKEECFGVALADQNDCKADAGTSYAGTAKREHQGHSWVFAPTGSCEKTLSRTAPTGFGQPQKFKEQDA